MYTYTYMYLYACMYTCTYTTLGAWETASFHSYFSSFFFSLKCLVFLPFFPLSLERSSFHKKMNQHSTILSRRLPSGAYPALSVCGFSFGSRDLNPFFF